MAGAYQDFLDGLAERMAELEAGDPLDDETTLAPLSSERAAEQVIERVDKAIGKGAGVVTGGRRIDRPGAFVEPTILVDCPSAGSSAPASGASCPTSGSSSSPTAS